MILGWNEDLWTGFLAKNEAVVPLAFKTEPKKSVAMITLCLVGILLNCLFSQWMFYDLHSFVCPGDLSPFSKYFLWVPQPVIWQTKKETVRAMCLKGEHVPLKTCPRTVKLITCLNSMTGWVNLAWLTRRQSGRTCSLETPPGWVSEQPVNQEQTMLAPRWGGMFESTHVTQGTSLSSGSCGVAQGIRLLWDSGCLLRVLLPQGQWAHWEPWYDPLFSTDARTVNSIHHSDQQCDSRAKGCL